MLNVTEDFFIDSPIALCFAKVLRLLPALCLLHQLLILRPRHFRFLPSLRDEALDAPLLRNDDALVEFDGVEERRLHSA